jgi:hypothetical protein
LSRARPKKPSTSPLTNQRPLLADVLLELVELLLHVLRVDLVEGGLLVVFDVGMSVLAGAGAEATADADGAGAGADLF